jgi:hypothetical protein
MTSRRELRIIGTGVAAQQAFGEMVWALVNTGGRVVSVYRRADMATTHLLVEVPR